MFENLPLVLNMPVSVDNEKIKFDPKRKYTPAELKTLIKLYADYHDVAEHELLVEYVDFALDLIKNVEDKALILTLATKIAELGRKKIIAIPEWLTDVKWHS